MQPDVNAFLLGQFLRLAFRADIESDDDGIGCRCQQHIGFGNRTDSGPQQFQADLVVRELRQEIAEHFHRTLHIALEDDVEFLRAGGLDLLRQAFERYPRTLGQRRFSRLMLAVLRNTARLIAISNHHKLIASLRERL